MDDDPADTGQQPQGRESVMMDEAMHSTPDIQTKDDATNSSSGDQNATTTPLSYKERLTGLKKKRAAPPIQRVPGDVIKTKKMWQPTEEFDIIDLKNDFWRILLSNREDEERAVRGGPWYLSEKCLSVQKWTPEFRASTTKVTKLATWIRLPGLPMQYYHEIALWEIGDFLGRTIKIDENTSNAGRGKFAKIAVELDLTQPLTPSFQIKDKWQAVEYEGLPSICYNCGYFGHGSPNCPEEPRQKSSVPPSQEGVEVQGNKNLHDNEGMEGKVGLGPWMVAQRRTRRYFR
ncbi:OLC1v1038890C1 [Oldenlandia corymbosa var. corymbosa]|uniref:OLC1v1038890C1 n=1 Tax=Oldenlandia corymbosa var. corymbosa TaxID=529605 RepID=A0AAV1D2E5_OLDCO|nr:OLC1v1038890C1 [Oldenlandia corymbosa var. corymbosa]